MAISVGFKTYKGISNISILRKKDNVLFNFPKPMSFNLNDNAQIQEQMTKSEVGVTVRVNTYETSRMSELSISYSSVQPEIYALRIGKTMEAQTGLQVYVPRTVIVPQSLSFPAATSGFMGFGATADDPLARCSYTDSNGISVDVPQNTFANWNTWKTSGVPEFALGANGALVFSEVLEDEMVTVNYPVVINGSKLTEQLVGDLRIDAILVDSVNRLTFLTIPNCTVNPSGGSLSSDGQQIDLNFFLGTLECSPYDLISSTIGIEC